MNIQNIPGTSIYGPPQQDNYIDQSNPSGNEVSSPGENRGIHFESGPAQTGQSDSAQHVHGADACHGSKAIDFSNSPQTNNTTSNVSEMGPGTDFSLGDQMQAFVSIIQDLVSLISNMLGANQTAGNDSYSEPDLNSTNAFPPSESATTSENQPTVAQSNPIGSTSTDAATSTVPNNHAAANEPNVSATSSSPTSGLSGTEQTPTVSEFQTINPGEGPGLIKDAEGKFVFNEVVDDSFLPEDVQQGMKEAVANNKDLSFFQDNFNSEQDMYQYLVHMANLESGGGASLENEHDAAGSGTGGSAGYMHLHMNYGLSDSSFGGAPLNTEGWSKDEVLSDYSKYTELTMKHIDGAYQSVGGASNDEGAEQAMALWWTGNDSSAAGSYYMEALSAGAGVNHNTGSAYM